MSRIAKAAAVTVAAGAVLAGSVGVAAADSDAQGAAVHSPGVVSGNVIQVPVDIPINICGNTVNIIAALNPAFGNTCVNASGQDKHEYHKVYKHDEKKYYDRKHYEKHYDKKDHDKKDYDKKDYDKDYKKDYDKKDHGKKDQKKDHGKRW